MNIKQLVKNYGTPYSEELGIDLKFCSSKEITKWFLASILFAARISESIAKNTYREFEKRGATTPAKFQTQAGISWLQSWMQAATCAMILKPQTSCWRFFGNLQKNYSGDLNKLHEEARDSEDLEEK